jgi:hypothetical protein
MFAVFFCLWLGFVGYIDWHMRQLPEVFGHVMARTPTPAYFSRTVKTLDTRASVRLASLWTDKPVALVFGSYV